MTSIASICNMALGHVGVSSQITDLDTESSKEALACRLFYEQCRDEVLRAFAWPFATTIEPLALVEEDPNDEWAFSYRYPAGCLQVRRLLSGVRNDSQETVARYRVARDSGGRLIFADLEDAEVEYTAQVTAAAEFDADFARALSYLLGASIAPQLAGVDKPYRENCMRLYAYAIAVAQGNAANEERPDQPPEAAMITART